MTTNNEIKERIAELRANGNHKIADKIEKICAEMNHLYDNFKRECEDISDMCVEEGYPSYGSNYELRCSYLYENYYRSEMSDLSDELENLMM